MPYDLFSTIPDGWRFYTADASILGRCSVMLVGPRALQVLEEGDEPVEALQFQWGAGPDMASAIQDAVRKI